MAIAGVSLGVLPLASALYGYAQRRRCRDTVELNDQTRRAAVVDQVRELEAARRCDEVERIVRDSDPVLRRMLETSPCAYEHAERWRTCLTKAHANLDVTVARGFAADPEVAACMSQDQITNDAERCARERETELAVALEIRDLGERGRALRAVRSCPSAPGK